MTADLTQADLSTRLVGELRGNGFCILHERASATVHALASDLDPVFAETPFCEGDFYGRRTKRFGSLLRRSRHVADLVLDPVILSAVEAILGPGCERMQLNLAQAIEIHPGEVRQFPHRDQDMWRGADGTQEYLVNILWPLTSFKVASVATLDLSARVKIGALGEISVNALNIFNAKPEMTAVASPSDTPFDSTNYSAVGRFLGITISRDW